MIRTAPALALLALATLACAPALVDPWDAEMRVTRRTPVRPEPLATATTASRAAAPLVAKASPASPTAPVAPELEPIAAADLTVRRSALRAAMDAGPQRFMSKVTLRPFFVEKRFRGWELERFYENDPRFRDLDLRRGDVVLRINGLRIGRPDEFMRAWNEVRAARELRVDYLRGAKRRLLRISVVEDVPALARPGLPEPSEPGGPVDE